jgi:hypothetical protein
VVRQRTGGSTVNTMESVLVARLATALEMAQLHLIEAGKIIEALRGER